MKKRIFILIVIFLIILSAFMIWFFGFRKNNKNNNQNDLTIINELIIELGDPVPTVQDFINETINNSFKLSFEEYDDSVPFEYTIIYYDPNDKEVTSDEAIEHESLKKDYTSKEIVTSIGEFKVIINYKGKDYYSKLIVKDTTKPTLILKEVTINENEKVDINDFIDSITDNSRKEVSLSYVSALTDYEKLEKIDLSVGEHDVFIEAKDQSDNKVVVQTKLIVNKKQQTSTTKPNSTTSNQNTTQGSNSSSNSSTNTSQAQNPWDVLGITEYDYYNEPEFSWQTPYYSIESYGSSDSANSACNEDGFKIASSFKAFGCMPVKSHSGKLLGYYLDIVS